MAEDSVEVVNDISNVPTVFVDGAQGFAVTNGVAKINLYQIVQDFDGKGEEFSLKKVVVARLAMSPVTTKLLADWLNGLMLVDEVEQGQPQDGEE